MINVHCHLDASNIRLIDCINSVDLLLKTAVDVGYRGIAITDHETVAGHIEVLQKAKEMKEKGTMPKDFKIILGNELYLVESIEEVRDNYQGGGVTKFPHFILLACDPIGHRQIRDLSSRAWDNSFFTGLMERVPTEKAALEEVIMADQGHVIGSTACLGSEFAQTVVKLRDAEEQNDEELIYEIKHKIDAFLKWGIKVFTKEKFFIEIQPSFGDGIYYNTKAVQIAKAYGLKWIVATDVHFPRPEDRDIHRAFLNSKDGDREVENFYEACFAQTEDEIKERLNYLSVEDIQTAIDNTMFLGSMVEDYDLYHPMIIPRVELEEFEVRHLFSPAYNKYGYIKKFAYSEDEQDRFMLKLVEDGFEAKEKNSTLTKERFHIIMDRINTEFGELWEITQKMNTNIPSYYVSTREIINAMWEEGDSIVGIARGSVTGFYVAYLMDIVQMSALKWNLPHWRHLSKERPEMPDIDLDSEKSKRKQILEALKIKFGERKVLNICTFGREQSRSAVLTAARGLGIDIDTAQFVANLIGFERGQNWTLHDCLHGNEETERKPNREFINEIGKFDGWLEVALKIEHLIVKRSVHASGVFIFSNDFLDQNARMRAPSGQHVSQWDMKSSDAMGCHKVDCLTVEALDKLHTGMDMLVKDSYMEWQGSLRETYNKYIHPDVIDHETPEMWKMVGENKIPDIFQFDTPVGLQAAQKVKPTNLIEMAVANSLMRLMPDHGESPIDTYVKHKENIQLWYDEMENYGLTQEEVSVMEEHLLLLYGVADTQEVIMKLAMDSRIGNFTLTDANKLRKGVSKKVKKIIDDTKAMFFSKGKENGTSENMLQYVWNVQIGRQLGYSFSANHTYPYSQIGVQEMNLAFHYPSVYWNTAVLTVNAGANEDSEDNKGTKYGKVATAIGNMQQRGITVTLPDINVAGFSFTPDPVNNIIVFGLKGITGINDDICKAIIEHRTEKLFTSFMDFYNRMVETKIVKNGQMIQLIKAGCFDSLCDRLDAMKQYMTLISEPKSKLTLANLKSLIEFDLVPETYSLHVRYFRFREYITKKVYKNIPKPKDRLFILDEISSQFFMQNFTEEAIVEVVDGQYVISEKLFKKEYDKKMDEIRDWLSQDALLEQFNSKLAGEAGDKHASGSISEWEMSAVSYYNSEHELINIDSERYNVVNFFEMPETPEPKSYYEWRGRQIPEYDLVRIAGTVLDKDKLRNSVSLLTVDGVVTVKFHSGQFGFYDRQLSEINDEGKKTTIEKSWFGRGNLLLVTGFRRENNFFPKKYRDSIFQHTVVMIEGVEDNGELLLQIEREQVG
jgi:DNA polymerase-3 subunit alpha